MAKTATQSVEVPGAYHHKFRVCKDGRLKPTVSNRILESGLTELQMKFVSVYVSNGGNARAAVEEAGYSGKGAAVQASTLLRQPKIKAEIEKRQRAVAAVSVYTIEDHAKHLEEQRELALKANQHTAAAKIVELMGKLRGFYTDKIEITHKYEQMTDDELRMKVIALQEGEDYFKHQSLHHIENDNG